MPIDGAPVLRPVAGNPRFQRVINTRALLLRDTVENYFYIYVYDGWLQTSALDLPWTRPFITPCCGAAVANVYLRPALAAAAAPTAKPAQDGGVASLVATP